MPTTLFHPFHLKLYLLKRTIHLFLSSYIVKNINCLLESSCHIMYKPMTQNTLLPVTDFCRTGITDYKSHTFPCITLLVCSCEFKYPPLTGILRWAAAVVWTEVSQHLSCLTFLPCRCESRRCCCFFLCHPSGAFSFLRITHFSCLHTVSSEERGRKSVTDVGGSFPE